MTKQQNGFLALSALGVLALLYFLSPILTPFFLGLLLAYLFEPLIDKLQGLGLSRTPTVVGVLLCFVLLAVVSVLILIPLLEQQLAAFIQFVPTMVEWVLQTLLPWLQKNLSVQTSLLDPALIKTTILDHWQQAGLVAKNVFGVVAHSGFTIFVWLANLLLVPVVMFYLMRDWNGLLQSGRALIPKRYLQTVIGLLSECDEVLGAFIRGQLLVMLVLALMYAVGLSLVGLKMGMLIGFVSGLLSIIPFLGFCVGLVISLIVSLVQYVDVWHCVWVLLVFGIGHIVEGVILAPILVGDRIGLHPVMVIFAILAGGQLFGFLGALLALPTGAVAMVILRHGYQKYKTSSWYGRVN